MTKELEADFSGFLSATQRQFEDQKGNKHNWLKHNRLHKCIYHNKSKTQIKRKNEKYLCYVLKNPFSFCLCIFVYVCVWMHTHVCTSLHGRQRTTSGVIPYTIFLEKISLLSVAKEASVAGQQPTGTHLFIPPQHWDHKHAIIPGIFKRWVLAI